MRALPATAAALCLAGFAAAFAADGPTPAPTPPPTLNPLSRLDASALKDFRERPLFSPSRRPPAPPVAAEPEPEPEPAPEPPQEVAAPPPEPNLKLTGVLEGPDDVVAVVQDLGADTTWRLRLGDSVGGWLVTGIEPVALRLTYGEQEKEYRLFEPPVTAGSEATDDEGAPAGGFDAEPAPAAPRRPPGSAPARGKGAPPVVTQEQE